jgi:hypothetical protein
MALGFWNKEKCTEQSTSKEGRSYKLNFSSQWWGYIGREKQLVK